MKVYATELVLCSLVGWPTPKTFRVKVFHIDKCIADLKPKFIKASNRFIGAPRNRKGLSLSTFDCTDIKTEEPWPFNNSMCSKISMDPVLNMVLLLLCFQITFVLVPGHFQQAILKEDYLRKVLV